MAKRISFESSMEALLEHQTPWPRSGDRPFVDPNDPRNGASISNDKFDRLVAMLDGYKKSADFLIEKSIDNENDKSTLIYPIIFNYRHFIELSLKYQIYSYGRFVDIDENWRTHDLKKLWCLFETMLNRFGTEDPDDADSIVKDIVLEFSKIDPQSYSYRYPVDRNGAPITLAFDSIDIVELKDVMEKVDNYFNGCDGFLNNKTK